MSRFDDIQQHAFENTQNIFGDVAAWMPSNSSELQTGKVLYNSNDIQFAVDDRVFYEDAQYKIEYYKGTFNGLYENIKGGETEYINFNGKQLLVLGCEMKWDGNTFMLFCKEA